MTLYFIIGCYFAAASSLISGLYVFARDRKRPLSFVYLLFSISAFGWSGSLGAAVMAPDQATSLMWFRLEHVFVVFIPTVYYHLVTILVGLDKKHRNVLVGLYAGSVVLLLLNVQGMLITSVMPKLYFPYFKEPGTIYPLLIILFAFGVGRGIHLLFKTYKDASGHTKIKVRLFLIASLFGYAGGLPTFLPVYNIDMPPFLIFITPILYFIFPMALANMTQYRLADIASSLFRTMFYTLMLAIALVPSALMIAFMRRFLSGTLQLAGMMVFGFLLALLLFRVTPRSERFVRSKLFRKRQNRYETLRKFTNDMVTATDLNILRDRFETTLREAMQVTSVALYLVRTRRGTQIAGASAAPENNGASGGSVAYTGDVIPLWTASEALVNLAYGAKDVLVLGEMELMAREKSDKELDEAIIQMQVAQAEVCVPFKRDSKMLGLALLGPREGNRYYSPEDLDLLHILGQNTCVAVQNALLVDEIKRSYKALHRSQRLAAMEPILDGLSPRIRNPLLLSTLALDLFEDPVRNADRIQRQRVPLRTAVRKITTVLDDMHVLTMPYTPRFAPGDVNILMDEVIEELGAHIREKRLTLQRIYRAPSGTMIDAERLKQALFDLLLNAAEASEKGGRIRIRTRMVQLMQEGFLGPSAGVQVDIEDEGSGIAPEMLERVFDPFFTTKHASAAREAAGLGLSIAHRIVGEHRGNIELKSAPGKGTMVTITLPAEQAA